MKVDTQFISNLEAKIVQMDGERQPYFQFWSDLADFYLPRRYVWLLADSSARVTSMRNSKILDSTGTQAAKVLASGMMNGITSPARPWFSLSIAGRHDLQNDNAAQVWLDEVTRRMMLVMTESNFYNALAVMYLDLVIFGTAAMLIYEDYDSVIRCYNHALGEYYLAQDHRLSVNTFARKFMYTVDQMVSRWGEESVSERVRNLYKKGGASCLQQVEIHHMIEPNYDGKTKVAKSFPVRETYWEKGVSDGSVLAQNGYHEMPGVFPRWELTANDSYGACPAMEAIGDVKQLQQETLRKAQGLDKTISPPLLADIQLQNKPTATMPNGITYVAGVNNIGMKPAYQIQVPFGELTQDIMSVQRRVRETFFNDLFQMISNLDTVRSATEIDARKEEKLVLLGPVLERFENEALDPGITRIYSIMNRAGLIPPPPPSIGNAEIQIQYISILSTAQRALGAAPVERWMQFNGNLAAVRKDILNVVNWEELPRYYAEVLGVPAKLMVPIEVSQAATAAQNQAKAQDMAIQQSDTITKAAQQLSATDVGGGNNALQAVLGSTQ